MSENTVEQKLTLKDKIKYFFINPKILFERFIDKPKYGITLLILSIISGLYNLILFKLSNPGMKKIIETKTNNMDPRMAEIIRKSSRVDSNPILKFVSSGVGLIIGVFFTALIIFLILKVSKTAIKYKQVAAIYCLSSIPIAIGSIIKTVYMFISQKPAITPEVQLQPTTTYLISSSINIFSIWSYILIGIGIYTVAKTSKKKAIILGVIYFVLSAISSSLKTS